ncbi:MAG: trypsin-like peptidase domain-containing protein [Bryobacteraceae bacterium]
MPRLVSILILTALTSYAQSSSKPAGQPDRPEPGPVTLRDLSMSFEKLTDQVHRAVVQVFSTGYTTASDDSDSSNTSSLLSKQRATGSGVIVSADGYIITNNHVVRSARRIQVRLPASRRELANLNSILKPEGQLLDAKLIGFDRQSDVAVLKIDGANMPHLALGDSQELRQGQIVMAFGNPLGLEGSVSMGIVSAVARQIKPEDPMIYIQTDAPINPGNSGGPLIDADGKVVGINTFILSQSGGSEGIGFAIPSNIVKTVYAQIRKEGHVHRGQIGISAQTITPALAKGLSLPRDWGVLVADVEPDGPAESAGVKVGDMILSVNGKPMENARQLQVDVYQRAMGDKLHLALLRGGDNLKADVEVVELPNDPMRFVDLVTPENNLVTRLGILGIAIDKQLVQMLPELRFPYGIVVAAGSASDLSSGTGLQPGDVIYSVNGDPMTSVEALKKKLDEFKAGQSPVLQIQREEKLMFVVIELE